MNRFFIVLIAPLMLSACAHDPIGVRVTHDAPASPMPAVSNRTEPVFYNGKTYQVSVSPAGDTLNLSIAGMGPGQTKDANGLAVSALHHFACKDTQRAMLTSPATFEGGAWHASGRCG